MFGLVGHEDRLDRVSELLAARDRLDAELAVVVAAAQAEGAWAGCGHRSARRFLRCHGSQSPSQVTQLLARSRLLGAHPATARASENGSLSLGALDAITGVVIDRRVAFYRRDERLLLAKASDLSLEDFEALLAHWADLADHEHLADPGLDDARQFLSVQQRFFGGVDVWGTLDEFTAQNLLAALDAFDTGPDPTNDPARRGLRQRRADALSDIAAAALDSIHHCTGDAALSRTAATPTRPVSDTTIVIDLRTLAGRHSATDLDGLIAEVNGTTVSGRAIEALLCNSWVSALVLDARGTVVDATERSAPFTPTQRRLIAARDRCCVFPGCRRPPSHCDAHHLHFRSRNGTNALDNGALVCRRHHRLLHAGWSLRRDDTCWYATSPTGRTWSEPAGTGPPDTS